MMDISLLKKFRMSSISTNDVTKTHLEHLENFKGWIDLYFYIDVIKYQTYHLRLKKRLELGIKLPTLTPSVHSYSMGNNL